MYNEIHRRHIFDKIYENIHYLLTVYPECCHIRSSGHFKAFYQMILLKNAILESCRNDAKT